MLKIYHNPKCKKSRAGLSFLELNGIDHNIVDYLKTGLTVNDLKEILLKMNVDAEEIVRKQEDIFKKELKGKIFNNDEWIRIIIENPKLLQRPIVVGKTKAILAQPPEKVKEIL